MDADDPKPRKPTTIDWDKVKQRLEAARVAVERVWAPAAEETQRILKARAQALAREPVPAGAVDERIEVVEFLLAHERYAIESSYVREVFLTENLTPLPCTPDFVLGIVNLRGEILSVIDIRKFFDLPENGLTDLDKIIVLQSGNMLFGILADAVTGVRRIPVTGIQPSLPTLTGVRQEYLKGVTLERTVILDGGKLLAAERIVVQEQVPG